MVPLLALCSHKVAAKLHRVVLSQLAVAAEVATVQRRMVLMLKRTWEVAAVPDAVASSSECSASRFASADTAVEADSRSAPDFVQSFAVVAVSSRTESKQMPAKSLTAQLAAF